MTNAPKPYKRRLRNLLINPSYQLKYLFWLTLSGLVLVFLNAYSFYSYTRENYDLLVDLSPMTDEAKAQLYLELNQIVFRLGLISVGFLVVAGIIGVVLSHRTAGPMFHFKRVFRSIREGNLNARVHLRPKDDFQDVAKEFNDMMDSVLTKK